MKLLLLSLFVFWNGQAVAQDMASFSRYEPGQNPVSIGYDTWQLNEREGGAYFGIEQGSLRVPIYSTGTQGLSVYAKGSRLRMATPVVIRERNYAVPQELGNLDVGASWGYSVPNGEAYNVNVSYGASGSRLIDRLDKRELTATAIYRTAETEGSSWLYLVSYSNNRTVLNNIPIPGFAYSYARKDLRIIAGLPFLFVYWSPVDLVSLTTYATLNAAGAEAAWFVKVPVQIYAGWSVSSRVYQNVVSAPYGGDMDRLFYDTKELGGGLRLILGRTSRVSVGYAYQYQRNLFITDSLFNPSKSMESVPSAAGLNARFAWSF